MDAVLHRRVGIYGRCVVDDVVLLTRLSRRDPDTGWWTLPGGGMDFGETAEETLIREFGEETGLVPTIGPLLGARSQIMPPRHDRGPVQAVQFVFDVRASGAPSVREHGGSTDAAAWIRLDETGTIPLVGLARWALAG